MSTSTSYERAQAAARQAPLWAEWHYTPEEWRQWNAQVTQHARRPFVRAMWGAGIALVLIIAAHLVLLAGGQDPVWFSVDSERDGALMTAAACIAGAGRLWLPPFFVLAILLNWGPYTRARRWHDQRAPGPPVITIGPLAITQAGWEMPLFSRRWTLRQVQAVEQQGRVTLGFRLMRQGAFVQQQDLWLPVPPGEEIRARQIVGRFQYEILSDTAPVAPTPPPAITAPLPPLALEETRRLDADAPPAR